MSVDTLNGLVERCTEQLEPLEQQIKTALSHADVLYHDETGLYVEGKRHWVHVSPTQQLTHYQVHPRRGKEALDAIGILKDFQGVSVHDGWQSYWHYLCQHAFRNVHHLRELTFLSQEQHQAWAAELISLLLDIKAAVEQARNEGRTRLHPLEIEDWKVQFVSLLEAGYQANPPDPPPETSSKGRRKQSAARNLFDRISTHQETVLAFLDHFTVPFDGHPRRARYPDGQSPEKGLRLIPLGGFRSGLLPHSRLPLNVAQARRVCAGCSGTGLGRPSCFTCFLAYSNSHFLPLMLMLNVRYVYG
jgi:transposase